VKGISPSSMYMRGKGDQRYISGPIPLQETYKDTCGVLHSKGAHVKIKGDFVHKQVSK
jgi:hypothetical protein